MRTAASKLSSGKGGLQTSCPWLRKNGGKPAVRNFRGGAGNVSEGRTRTPLHISKEWRAETLDLRLCAPVLYSTRKAARTPRPRPNDRQTMVGSGPNNMLLRRPPVQRRPL